MKKKTQESITGYAYSTPALGLVLLMIIFPVAEAIRMSFYRVYLLKPGAPFVGVQMYTRLLEDKNITLVMHNTILWLLAITFFSMLIGLGLALILNRSFRFNDFISVLLFLPWVLPEVVIATVWRWMLDGGVGIINEVMVWMKLIKSYYPWLASEGTVLPACIAVLIWRTYPFVTIMVLAGLKTIPAELNEAAEVDGASKLQIFWYITLPQLQYVLLICTLIVFIWTINQFGIPWVMTQGGPLYFSTTLAIYIYRLAFWAFRLSQGAALSTILFLIILVFSIIYLKLLRVVKEA